MTETEAVWFVTTTPNRAHREAPLSTGEKEGEKLYASGRDVGAQTKRKREHSDLVSANKPINLLQLSTVWMDSGALRAL